MTRRLRSRNRKYAGNRTYGGGNKKNRRGKGSKGGRGRAGYHKHKWMRTIKYELETLRMKHKGFNSQYAPTQTVTLEQLNKVITKAKASGEAAVLNFNFPNAKVIGSLQLTAKANVTAFAFSKGAKASIEKAGGTATATAVPVQKTPAAAPAKPEAKAEAKKK